MSTQPPAEIRRRSIARGLVRGLTLVGAVLATTLALAGPASAQQSEMTHNRAVSTTSTAPVAGTDEFQIAVAWPFNTCEQRPYVHEVSWLVTYVYNYDHTDFGRINYYRVHQYVFGDYAGFIGWASCSM